MWKIEYKKLSKKSDVLYCKNQGNFFMLGVYINDACIDAEDTGAGSMPRIGDCTFSRWLPYCEFTCINYTDRRKFMAFRLTFIILLRIFIFQI